MQVRHDEGPDEGGSRNGDGRGCGWHAAPSRQVRLPLAVNSQVSPRCGLPTARWRVRRPTRNPPLEDGGEATAKLVVYLSHVDTFLLRRWHEGSA